VVRPYIGHDLFAGPGAAVVLKNEAGEILMLKHVGEDHWRLPSGFSNIGENAAQTAVREVKEELGLEIELLRLIGVHASPELNTVYANGDRVRNVGAVFLARRRGGELTLDHNEIADYAWMSPQEARAVVHPSRARFYERIIDCLERGCFVS
jgi:ADP-ribose pyrophosphatase YjhB (NUDIX family)